MSNAMTRSRFLLAGAALTIPPLAAAPVEPTPAEKANLALVADFCTAFATRDITKIASYLASNCSYRITETAMPATRRGSNRAYRKSLCGAVFQYRVQNPR